MKSNFSTLLALVLSTIFFGLQSANANDQKPMTAFEGTWVGECKNSADTVKYQNELKVEAATLQSITINENKYVFDQTVKFENALGDGSNLLLLVNVRKPSQTNRISGTSYRIIHDWNLSETKAASTNFDYYFELGELVRVTYVQEDNKQMQWICRYHRQ